MSDEIEVTHGGAIAVDPTELRVVANALSALAPRFADAAAAVRRAHGCLIGLPNASTRVDTVALWGSIDRAEALHEESRVAGENTLLMADVYELVERRVELDALAIQGKTPPDALYSRIAELEASDPRILDMEAYLLEAWKERRHEGLDGQYQISDLWGAPGALQDIGVIFGVAATLGAKGFGRLPPNATLSGVGGAVSVTAVKTSTPVAPPGTISEALRRFPDESGAQIKVEKYTMANGTRKFVLYEKGTQPRSLIDPNEPFDMKSNFELYTGQKSASYVATVDALKAAGAQPGDEVHVYAHSQGAMNAAYLSSGSEFDVSVQVTAGSPLMPTLDDDQLHIALRFTDDVVNNLAGGGLPGGSGSPDSLVVTSVGDPGHNAHDIWLHPHMMEGYIDMTEMLEDTDDIRLEAWRDKQRELADAVSIESTEYVAKRE